KTTPKRAVKKRAQNGPKRGLASSRSGCEAGRMKQRRELVARNRGARRTLTRRGFVGATAGAMVATFGAWLWMPIVSPAQTEPGSPGGPAPTEAPAPRARVVSTVAPANGERMFLEFPAPAEGGGIEPLTITGDSTDTAHPGAIEVMSALLGMQNPMTIG